MTGPVKSTAARRKLNNGETSEDQSSGEAGQVIHAGNVFPFIGPTRAIAPQPTPAPAPPATDRVAKPEGARMSDFEALTAAFWSEVAPPAPSVSDIDVVAARPAQTARPAVRNVAEPDFDEIAAQHLPQAAPAVENKRARAPRSKAPRKTKAKAVVQAPAPEAPKPVQRVAQPSGRAAPFAQERAEREKEFYDLLGVKSRQPRVERQAPREPEAAGLAPVVRTTPLPPRHNGPAFLTISAGPVPGYDSDDEAPPPVAFARAPRPSGVNRPLLAIAALLTLVVGGGTLGVLTSGSESAPAPVSAPVATADALTTRVDNTAPKGTSSVEPTADAPSANIASSAGVTVVERRPVDPGRLDTPPLFEPAAKAAQAPAQADSSGPAPRLVTTIPLRANAFAETDPIDATVPAAAAIADATAAPDAEATDVASAQPDEASPDIVDPPAPKLVKSAPAAKPRVVRATPGTAQVAQDVTIRAAPNKTSARVGTVAAGKTINIVPGCRGWCEVSYDGKHGYIFKSFLKL